MHRTAVVLGLLLAACSAQSPSAPQTTSPSSSAPKSTPSGSSTPAATVASPLAVIATGGGQSALTIHVIDGTARELSTVSVASRTFVGNILAPWYGISASRVYYLDGPSQVRWLTPEGKTGLATTIPVSGAQQASFAVSPDDRRIAVAILTYATPAVPSGSQGLAQQPKYLGMRLYVEDLSGANRVDLFSSSTVAEFPVGWHAGNLVLGVGNPFCCQSVPPNPYAVSTYHVVDPITGNRLATICSAPSYSIGAPAGVGTLCYQATNESLVFESWDGVRRPIRHSGIVDDGALGPKGDALAIGGNQVTVLDLNGNLLQSLSGVAVVLGWLQPGYLLVTDNSGAQWQLVDLRAALDKGLSAAAKPLPAGGGQFLGVLPASLR